MGGEGGFPNLLEAKVVVLPFREDPALGLHLDSLQLSLLAQLSLELDGLAPDLFLPSRELLSRRIETPKHKLHHPLQCL